MNETSNESNHQNKFTELNNSQMSSSKESNEINIENDRYPYSIVWCPLPVYFLL